MLGAMSTTTAPATPRATTRAAGDNEAELVAFGKQLVGQWVGYEPGDTPACRAEALKQLATACGLALESPAPSTTSAPSPASRP